MNIDTKDILGKWTEYTLTNDQEMTVSVLDFGGVITKIMVPDQKGNIENVVLGYREYRDYESNSPYFGAIIGRVAGRIQGASFELGGKTYKLSSNNGGNHLHGGHHGFHQKIWDVTTFKTDNEVGLKLSLNSADGEGGYPGNLEVTVIYTLNNDNQLILDYLASSDQSTPISLTNHTYFNLSGNIKNCIQDHVITIDSRHFLELDNHLIPTGKLIDVKGTAFDFQSGLKLGTGLKSNSVQNVIVGNGYDHYFIFDNKIENNVIIEELTSGRKMSVKTNQPGMVMYTANTLEVGLQLAEGISQKYLGVCIETQGSPASLHHEGFPSIILRAGENYKKQSVYTFSLIV